MGSSPMWYITDFPQIVCLQVFMYKTVLQTFIFNVFTEYVFHQIRILVKMYTQEIIFTFEKSTSVKQIHFFYFTQLNDSTNFD